MNSILERRLAWALQELEAGTLGPIAASRQASHLLLDLGLAEFDDPDRLAFVALDSETDHLPIGPPRAFWEPNALASKDQQILMHETGSLSDAVRTAARSFQERLALPDWRGHVAPQRLMSVREAFSLSGKGVGVLGADPLPNFIAKSPFPIQFRDPFGTGDLCLASLEFVRRSEVNEEAALLLHGPDVSAIPNGTEIDLLPREWGYSARAF